MAAAAAALQKQAARLHRLTPHIQQDHLTAQTSRKAVARMSLGATAYTCNIRPLVLPSVCPPGGRLSTTHSPAGQPIDRPCSRSMTRCIRILIAHRPRPGGIPESRGVHRISYPLARSAYTRPSYIYISNDCTEVSVPVSFGLKVRLFVHINRRLHKVAE